MRPSFIASVLSGLLILYAFILVILNYKKINIKDIIIIILLFALVLGLHAIHHYYEEIFFNFNPFIGKWNINDIPIN